jgi:glyceraldehyde-3-phosphate dehydrogenase (NADP+)
MTVPGKMLIGGEWVATDATAPVVNPYTGKPIADVCQAGAGEADAAVRAARRAFEITRKQTAHQASSLLKRVVDGLIARKGELIGAIVAESGKPVTFADAEVNRSIATFTVAAHEATRIGGEYLPLDAEPAGAGRFGVTKRFPIGVVLGVTPFNFPLNLVAHKVAPVLASRNTMVLKPAPQTPLTALLLGEILTTAGMTPGQVNIVPTGNDVAESLVRDDRIAKVSFTGSAPVGWKIKSMAGMKKVTLELGGNAAAIVMADADLKWAVPRLVVGAYGYAGQTCIAVQRILVHASIHDKLVRALKKEIAARAKVGNPTNRATMVGPMIDGNALSRTDAWVKEAVAQGATLVTGGKRRGRCYEPTLLTGVTKSMKVVCEEAFAPVAAVQSFTTLKQAVAMVNDSAFGLQVGIFTNRMDAAQTAFEECDVGGVIVNDFPTFRVDAMPYGGVKGSGLGREGVRYAIDEMTEIKVMVMGK